MQLDLMEINGLITNYFLEYILKFLIYNSQTSIFIAFTLYYLHFFLTYQSKLIC